MVEVGEVGRVIIIGLVLLFVLGITGYIFFILLGAYTVPVFKYLLSGSGYEGLVDNSWTVFKIVFIILILSIFGYIIVKIFFEREPTVSGYYGGY